MVEVVVGVVDVVLVVVVLVVDVVPDWVVDPPGWFEGLCVDLLTAAPWPRPSASARRPYCTGDPGPGQ